MMHEFNRSALWPMLLLCLSLTACAASSPLIVQPRKPEIPKPSPELMKPPKQPESYSENAQADIKRWREKLEGLQGR